ncbi:hypothetical protein ACJMK2_040577 [Sinanodonta woodiana]
MKESNGTFKAWAVDNDVRNYIESSVLYGYYTLYGLITFCLFVWLPLMYFFYEERDEVSTCKTRCCGALKYCIAFLIILVTLFLIGFFVPGNGPPADANSTELIKIKMLFENLGSIKGTDALSFIISVLSLLGMLALLTYTAYGMAALPIGLVKGRKNVKTEIMTVQERKAETQSKIRTLREKYSSQSASTRDRQRISDLEESEHLIERQERHLVAKSKSCLEKCFMFLRPFEIVFGIFFILLTFLIFLSLLLTNIDKAMHSQGYQTGYALPKRTLPNPVDIVLVFCQQVFPLDYILFSALVLYLVFCSMSGVRNIGIWFFWLRMYKIRPRHTRPQALLMLCMILMFVMLAVNIIVYELTPQYTSYGGQHYLMNVTTGNVTKFETKDCSGDIDVPSGECTLTRMTLLLTVLFYNMWFFGAAYYWITWAFLLVILLGFLIAIIRKRKSSIEGEVEQDDFDESDDEMLSP